MIRTYDDLTDMLQLQEANLPTYKVVLGVPDAMVSSAINQITVNP